MDDYEKYFFDLNGYIVLDEVLSPEEVARCNEAIDHNRDHLSDAKSRRAHGGTGLSGGSEPLAGKNMRRDFHDCLSWPKPWCDPFRAMLGHPRIMPYLEQIMSNPFLFTSLEGFVMDPDTGGGILHGGGVYQPHVWYRFTQGRMKDGHTAVCFVLADSKPGDGGFACIPGSHKANYPLPGASGGPESYGYHTSDVARMERDIGVVKEMPFKAGSVLIFTESLTHGTLPWKADHERQVVFFRYCPVQAGAFRSHFSEDLKDDLDDFTPEQQAVLIHPDTRE